MEALDFIGQIKKKHYDAKHNVFAYILQEGLKSRFSDDGEPSGTAGLPVLSVLQKRSLSDTAIVVTRYFGGILLGAGGLARAYSHGASMVADKAQVIHMEYCSFFHLEFSYSLYGKIQGVVCGLGGKMPDCDFSQTVKAMVYIPEKEEDELKAALIEASLGDISILYAKSGYVEV
ncbi:IMPACT family member YigZ [bioreactor metagenome]|uniref:IMPACT family member YigZ n=1 Tax=bioreactor metagenome TaxID=1076179 RepID=A0A645H2G6_9ZZZZ